MLETYPFYLANEPSNPNRDLEVTNKYTGEVATRVAIASTDDIDRAIAAGRGAHEDVKRCEFPEQPLWLTCRNRSAAKSSRPW